MVRAVDESVKNITDTYKKLGIFDDTIGVLTTDNGGHPAAGGSNYPLRGQKATLYEGARFVASRVCTMFLLSTGAPSHRRGSRPRFFVGCGARQRDGRNGAAWANALCRLVRKTCSFAKHYLT